MDREEILARVSDEEAIEFYREKMRLRALRLASLAENDKLAAEKEVLCTAKGGIISGVWTLEEVQDILENRKPGWQELIKPYKLELAVVRGLVSISEV